MSRHAADPFKRKPRDDDDDDDDDGPMQANPAVHAAAAPPDVRLMFVRPLPPTPTRTPSPDGFADDVSFVSSAPPTVPFTPWRAVWLLTLCYSLCIASGILYILIPIASQSTYAADGTEEPHIDFNKFVGAQALWTFVSLFVQGSCIAYAIPGGDTVFWIALYCTAAAAFAAFVLIVEKLPGSTGWEMAIGPVWLVSAVLFLFILVWTVAHWLEHRMRPPGTICDDERDRLKRVAVKQAADAAQISSATPNAPLAMLMRQMSLTSMPNDATLPTSPSQLGLITVDPACPPATVAAAAPTAAPAAAAEQNDDFGCRSASTRMQQRYPMAFPASERVQPKRRNRNRSSTVDGAASDGFAGSGNARELRVLRPQPQTNIKSPPLNDSPNEASLLSPAEQLVAIGAIGELDTDGGAAGAERPSPSASPDLLNWPVFPVTAIAPASVRSSFFYFPPLVLSSCAKWYRQMFVAYVFSWLAVANFQFNESFSQSLFNQETCGTPDVTETGTHDSSARTAVMGLLQFVLFSLVNAAFRGVFKTLGNYLDAHVMGSTCFYLQGELIVALNYCIFYRFLFAQIESNWVFAVLQGLHLIMEWGSYPLRCTHAYFHKVNQLCHLFPTSVSKQGSLLRRLLAPAPFELNEHDTSCFVCLDFALRNLAFVSMSITFAGIVLLGRFGWNSDVYCLKTQTDAEFKATLWFLAASVVTESLNLYAMERFFWRPRHLSMLQRLYLLYQNKRFYLFSIGIFAGITYTAILSRLRVNLL